MPLFLRRGRESLWEHCEEAVRIRDLIYSDSLSLLPAPHTLS